MNRHYDPEGTFPYPFQLEDPMGDEMERRALLDEEEADEETSDEASSDEYWSTIGY